jgi:hypothetical protein
VPVAAEHGELADAGAWAGVFADVAGGSRYRPMKAASAKASKSKRFEIKFSVLFVIFRTFMEILWKSSTLLHFIYTSSTH